MTSNATVCRFFFEKLREARVRAPANERIERNLDAFTSAVQPDRAPQRSSHRFQCRFCPSIIAHNPSRGYTNLMNHVRARHPDYKQAIQTMVAETAVPYACSERLQFYTLRS
ncbi:hypothetical protein PF005_g9136 [Phytophthora fragariae]|uniref:BED-type domain-containing protein n=1 Tax=Phytophthora fragariae TaxID=53985 RepID=A0A6A3SB67_9STRA|nr:hypothetical protein PF009_g6375 [Phytophthora fragariae]KAE9113498.1 hypothetical protein PF007_g10719 [Phytophthora fragariae]KAE9145465.1 hypothetical protein PF006_g9671 [Phytophthora fragariae]KAE9216241.1 hypothetical protein PF005_g9136 [Phytophthora fragariae]KAE9314371.1 hypothetical protein PF001_g8303 [Phytophthora fragariae]